MCNDYEKYSLPELISMARKASSGSAERKDAARAILKDKAHRARLFQIATTQDRGRQLKARNDIIWLMQESGNINGFPSYRENMSSERPGKVWMIQGSEHSYSVEFFIYEEALVRTWAWFGKSFDKYQPASASPVSWFNRTLKFRIIDVQNEVAEEQKNRQQGKFDEEAGTFLDPLDLLTDLKQDPESTTIHVELIKSANVWLNQKQKSLARKYVPGNPHANCYVILLKRLPKIDPEGGSVIPGDTFHEISKSLNVEEPAARRCFRDKCWPQFKTFLDEQGF